MSARLTNTALLLTRFRWVVIAIVQVGILAHAVAERDPARAVALTIAAWLGWWITESGPRPGARGLPRWASGTLLIVILLAVAIRLSLFTGAAGSPVSAFATFLSAIIAVKMWERRQVRDYGQIIMLALFQAVGATLSGTSLALGIVLVAFVPLLAVGVMMYQVLAAEDRLGQPGAPLHSPAALAGRLWRLSLACSLLAIPIAAGVFLGVPRGVGYQEWGPALRQTSRRVTGFADQVDLTRGGLISESSARVLWLSLREEPAGRTLGGLGERYYLRGAVLDSYHAGVWSRAEHSPHTKTVPFDSGQFHALERGEPRGRTILQEIQAADAAPVDTPVFSIYRPRSVEFGLVQSTIQVTADPQTCVMTRRGGGEGVIYRVRAVVSDAPQAPDVAPADRRGFVGFPNDQVASFAREQLSAAGVEPDPAIRPRDEDALAVRKLEAFLRLNYSYTLAPPVPPLGQDPLAFFLFESRAGHCEYFASALAAMSRAVGVDARVISGYLANEFDEERGRYVVRASNAHAWVEACVAPGLWRTYDATPPAQLSLVAARQASILGRLSRLLDHIEESWNTSVVSFDEHAQDRLLGRSPGEPGLLDRASHWFRRQSLSRRTERGAPKGPYWRWIAAGVAGSGVAIGAVLVWVARRRRAPAAAGWGLWGPHRRTHDRLVKLLARRGFRKPPWMSLAQAAACQDQSDPWVAGHLIPAVRGLYAEAFARGESAGAG